MPENLGWIGVAVAAVFLSAQAAGAGDVVLVSTTKLQSTSGKKLLEPCVHNNAAEPKIALIKIGNGAVRWAYPPVEVNGGETKCVTFDAPPLGANAEAKVYVE